MTWDGYDSGEWTKWDEIGLWASCVLLVLILVGGILGMIFSG